MNRSVPTAIRCLCVVSALCVIVGCDEIKSKFRKEFVAGTLRQYRNCIEQNKELGLSLLKELCKSQFVGKIHPEVEGRAGYQISSYGTVSFSGSFENKSRGFVITTIKVGISHKDNVDDDGKPIVERLVADNLWVEPFQTQTFDIQNLDFKPKKDRLNRKEKKDEPLYSWWIISSEGLRIILG